MLRGGDALLVFVIILDVALGIKSKASGKGKGKGKGKGRGKGAKQSFGKAHPANRASVCASYVAWAMRVGITEHPERYPGLTANSSMLAFQQRLHMTTPASRCPDAYGNYTAPTLPTFTSQLALNKTQLAAYRELRKAHAETLKSDAFKRLTPAAKQAKRRQLAASTAAAMQAVLNASQLALFTNRSAVLRRPPSMHIAATLVRSKASVRGGALASPPSRG